VTRGDAIWAHGPDLCYEEPVGKRVRATSALASLALVLLASSRPGEAKGLGEPTQAVPAARTPAERYAALDASSCAAELAARRVPFAPVDVARGVLAPIRLTGPIRGVSFHSELATSARPASPYEILDCRLALALDDFAAVLAGRGITEVVHLSMYRPPPRGWPSASVASRHGGGLAIDAARFIKADGTVLDVDRDFAGRIGEKPCGPSAAEPKTIPSAELRGIVCEAAQEHLFQVELTPDFNQKHKNHFHLEVAAKVKWFFVR
jgi:hypothetical protein